MRRAHAVRDPAGGGHRGAGCSRRTTAHWPVDIVLLWLLIVATVIGFWRVRLLAGALLLPYLCWVSFTRH